MNKHAYLLIRLTVAVSMFGHGMVRILKLQGFSSWMVTKFEKSLLPEGLVRIFSYLLPFAELITGILLIVGLFTRQALLAGGIIMILLVFGSCMVEDWNAIPTQMIHAAFFAFLLNYIDHNSYTVEKTGSSNK